MRQYFLFIFRRAEAPLPASVVILQRPEDWINRHIIEEWQFAFPETTARLLPTLEGKEADLIVLPFIDDFIGEAPGGGELYQRLQGRRSTAWVMLYGLNRRRIDLVRPGQLYRYYQTRRSLVQIREILQNVRIWRFVRKIIELGNWRCR